MAFHLYGKTPPPHLGKLNGHLVYGDGRVFLSPSDYTAYQLGHYTVAQGLAACDRGFVFGGWGTLKTDAVANAIISAENMITNDSGYWIQGGNFVPRFVACCGNTALGCFANSTGTQEMALNAGCYVMVPKLKFALPRDKTAKSARIRFKGYSDYMIEAQTLGSGTGYVNQWAYDMRDFRLNNSISGYSHTVGHRSGSWCSYTTDLLIAHADPNPDEMPIQLAFRSNFWHGQRIGDGKTYYRYDLVLNGLSSAVGTSKSLKYYLGNNTNMTYNPTFCGAIGTNAYPSGGSTLNYTNAYPLCVANDGTKNHTNALTGASWGEIFVGYSGTLFKKTGGHFYTDKMLPTASKNDTSWLVAPYIDLTSWQLRALNSYGYIWVMYSNPCPWFATTDYVELHGASRQIYVEDCKLEVELE